MNKRIKYRIVIDTETCPINAEETAVIPSNMWVYDCGWAVVDRHGNIYKAQSFVNADIFLDERDLMNSAYYAEKIPQYWEEIENGERTLAKFSTIRKALFEDVEEYGVTEIYAHNMRFDYGTLNATQRWLTKSASRYFFPYGVDICDTLKMSRQIIGTMPTYKKYCIENGYTTKNGRPKMTAEILYRFISGNETFEEAHTALQDVFIEKEILAYLFRQHKKMDRKLWD